MGELLTPMLLILLLLLLLNKCYRYVCYEWLMPYVSLMYGCYLLGSSFDDSGIRESDLYISAVRFLANRILACALFLVTCSFLAAVLSSVSPSTVAFFCLF